MDLFFLVVTIIFIIAFVYSLVMFGIDVIKHSKILADVSYFDLKKPKKDLEKKEDDDIEH